MADKAQYVTLGIAEDVFAVPVTSVREIQEVRPVSRMPGAPGWFLGMIDVRGQGVPVIDLRLKLGLGAPDDTVNTRVLVLAVTVGERSLQLGIKTDRVFEVAVLDADDLEAPPEIGVRWNTGLIAGVGRRNGGFVTVLDLDRLMNAGELAQLTGQGPVAEAV